jgi:hypothetical protein
MIFLSLFSLLLSKFTLAIQNLRVTHFFIEISTSVLILFISNFCSWLFYKISVCFQFHHWIQICNMLIFFFIWGLFFFIVPFNKKLLVVLYLFFISILIVIHFIIIFLILLYNWFFFFNFIIQYLVGWELGFAVFVDEVLLV